MLYHPIGYPALGQVNDQPQQTQMADSVAITMVLRGAMGTLIGAAAAPKGAEGLWGAAGFVLGATLGEVGIVGVAFAALWRKTE